jgi:hypothetical protein
MTMDPGVGDLEQTDVLINRGRIVAIGRGLKAAPLGASKQRCYDRAADSLTPPIFTSIQCVIPEQGRSVLSCELEACRINDTTQMSKPQCICAFS